MKFQVNIPKVSIFGILIFAVALVIVPLPRDKLNAPQAYRYFDLRGELLAVLISDDDYFRMRVPYESLSPLLPKAIIAKEDKYFHQHFGINPISIIRAAMGNLRSRRIVSGGSTITMQLARMLERRPRTYLAKLIECFRAIQLEIAFSKEEILAKYLSIAPYGGNLEGVEAAAFYYFDHSAAQLSIGEIALLAAIPQSPNQLRPDKHPIEARAARDSVLKTLFKSGLINNDTLKRSLAEVIPTSRRKTKNVIPHLAWGLRREFPEQTELATTIDFNIQSRVNTLLLQHFDNFEEFNISNGAVVVLDNDTHEVRALVGSRNYFDAEALGANDGTRAPRSPGSTLKPFLYGLGLDKGLISEQTTLFDIPSNYAGYRPQNYSKNFIGTVSAREALTESMNVVAVKLSHDLGVEMLYNLLINGGVTTLERPVQYYGLPLVLGGVEIPLIELTNLFSALANSGEWSSYKLVENRRDPYFTKRILSPEATWIIGQILTDVERPDFPSSWEFSKTRPTIAWKTGTSYANQDAWSIGFNPEFTIGVWLGNFDGTLSKGLVGRDAAAPLLFDIFQVLSESENHEWFDKPRKVKKRDVCAVSGRLPNQFCPILKKEYFISGISGPATEFQCQIHQNIHSGSGSNATVQVHEIWPPEMARFLLKHGVPVRKVPPYDPGDMAGEKYYPPKILSPAPNTVYYKRYDRIDHGDHGIKLAAAVTNRVRNVYWFLDGKEIANIDPKEDVIVNPGPGSYEIRLIDDVGGSASVKLVVKDFRESKAIAK